MLVGAFGAAAVALATGSPEKWAHLREREPGFFSRQFMRLQRDHFRRANQIVAGAAINMWAAGVTPFLCKILYDSAAFSQVYLSMRDFIGRRWDGRGRWFLA